MRGYLVVLLMRSLVCLLTNLLLFLVSERTVAIRSGGATKLKVPRRGASVPERLRLGTLASNSAACHRPKQHRPTSGFIFVRRDSCNLLRFRFGFRHSSAHILASFKPCRMP